MLIRMRKIKAVCWVYAVHMQGRFDLDLCLVLCVRLTVVPHRASFVISDHFFLSRAVTKPVLIHVNYKDTE